MTRTKFRSISLVYVVRISSSWFCTGLYAGTLFQRSSQSAGLPGVTLDGVLGAGAGDEVESEGWEWCRS
jgi:hypothetical protein